MFQCPGPGWRGAAANIRVSEDCAVAEWKVTVTVTVTAPAHSLCFLGRLLQQLTLQTTSTFPTHNIYSVLHTVSRIYSTLSQVSVYYIQYLPVTLFSAHNLVLLYLHYSSHSM